MNGSQIYIGTPNGVVLCVDGVYEDRLDACFYTSYSRDPVRVESWVQLLFEMEYFFDQLHFPYSSTNNRSFKGDVKKEYWKGRKEKIVRDEELLMNHGDLGSFIIRVQHRQNSSWQGRITWVENNKTMMFRSVWEMIKLMESALDTHNPGEEPEFKISWNEE